MADKKIKGTVNTTGETVGATAGGVAGVAAGAAVGSIAGPIGTIVGGLAGAVGGWWSGRAVADAASSYSSDDDTVYQEHYGSSRAGGQSASTSYDEARPAYQLGHLAGMNPDYKGRTFDEVETDLQTAYTSSGRMNWKDVRGHAKQAYQRGQDVGEQRLTVAEEELRVGKRQVQTGEATIRKTVETEHVSQSVPLTHEEVTIERRPVREAGASRDIEITDDEIRIPLMAEEAVVEKRVVGVEEVVLKKHAVIENQTVEADLRKERVEIDRGSTASEGVRSVVDKIDDTKDSVEGGRVSKPGRNSTDRPGR